jgi:hypothetical protein
LAGLVVGCGSSGSPSSTTSSASTSASAPSPSTTAASPDDAAAIKAVYEKFFNSATPTSQSIPLLQNGATFASAVEAQAKSPLSKGSTVKVSAVKVNNASFAVVTFSVLINGSPVLNDQHGFAVKQNGSWKVAATTFCGLVSLSGKTPPACLDAKATALPG